MARRASPAASIAGLIGAALLAGCAGEPPAAARGRSLVQAHGCGACHVIPGVPGARGRAGPSLEAVGRRAYLGGVVPNSREGMARWLAQPRHADPGTAMPDLGLTVAEAEAMAAYLSMLR